MFAAPLLACLCSAPAPVPRPRPAPPAPPAAPAHADLVGAWSLYWSGSEYRYSLDATGTCWGCVPGADFGTGYGGTWRVEKGELVIEEHHMTAAGKGGEWRYRVKWDRLGRGRLEGDAVRLGTGEVIARVRLERPR